MPSLNQAEYDYLHAFSRSRRSYRPDGAYAVVPEDPHTGSSEREVELYNKIADGQPGYWCHWVPCPHGCCLVWDGREKFYTGQTWLQYLIDHFLRHRSYAQTSSDPQFASFTFDHEMNGIVVGEQEDNRELSILRVEANEVAKQILRRGDPILPWEPGYVGLEDRPWLAGERPWRSSLDSAHVDAEVLSALGWLERTGSLDAVEAADGLRALSELPLERHALQPLLRGSWASRKELRLVDGLYVELAWQLGMRLLTTDQRLAGSVPIAKTIN